MMRDPSGAGHARARTRQTGPASSADVARAAGVSKWTVIRAFEPGGAIAPETRERVMAAAATLGYRPNQLARSHATHRTHQVAILVDDFMNPFKMPVLNLLTAALQQAGMLSILVNIRADYGHAEAIVNAWQRQIDAIVLFGTSFHREMVELITSGRNVPPHFVLGRHSTVPGIPSVCCDAAPSIAAAADHLWARGYRRPVYLGVPLTGSTSLGRRRGHQAFWRQRGIDLPELDVADYDHRHAAAIVRPFLGGMPAADRPDVLICENDVLAIGAMEVIRGGLGLRVPEDIAVIGYDDIDLAGLPSFDLTTIRQPVEAMVAELVAMILGRRPAESRRLLGQLVVRSST